MFLTSTSTWMPNFWPRLKLISELDLAQLLWHKWLNLSPILSRRRCSPSWKMKPRRLTIAWVSILAAHLNFTIHPSSKRAHLWKDLEMFSLSSLLVIIIIIVIILRMDVQSTNVNICLQRNAAASTTCSLLSQYMNGRANKQTNKTNKKTNKQTSKQANTPTKRIQQKYHHWSISISFWDPGGN